MLSPFSSFLPSTPPMWLRSRVDLLPITSGISSPPAKAIYPRLPFLAPANISFWPFFTRTALYIGKGCPSSIGVRSPPVTAIILSLVKVRVGPIKVISRAPSVFLLPTRRLAIWKARGSMAPDVETPNAWFPNLPSS